MLKKTLIGLTAAAALTLSATANAEDYVIDTEGAHAFIQFKISHLGYSWLLGRFNEFEGNFSYDEKSPESSKVSVTINTASVDSNHAERDKHLRSDDFLDVKKYPKASFNSTSYTPMGNGKAKVTGDLTLHGVTRSVDIDVTEVGHGDDPWGGYRRGFYGKTTLALKDYNIKMDLGPASREVELFLSVEGIRKK